LATITEQFQNLSSTNNITLDKEKPVLSFYRKLSKTGKTLLIFDNVNTEAIEEYLPKSDEGYSKDAFHVIVTTRDQNEWLNFQNLVHLDTEDETIRSDSQLYIERRLGCSEKKARLLSKTLHYFPLAITQAVAYIKQDVLADIDEYVRLFKAEEQRQTLLTFPGDDVFESAKNTVLITWNLSLSQLTDDAKCLIEHLVFMSPNRIRIKLLSEIGLLSTLGLSSKQLNNSILELLQYSLVSNLDSEVTFIKMHRLLQEAIQLKIDNPKKYRLLEVLLEHLNQDIYYDRYHLKLFIERIEHFLSFKDLYHDTANQSFGELCYSTGLYFLDHICQAKEAIPFFEKAIKSFKENKHEKYQKALRQIAKAHTFDNNLQKAQYYYKQINVEAFSEEEKNKFLLDKVTWFKKYQRYEEADALINQVLKSTEDPQILARCYRYLANAEMAQFKATVLNVSKNQRELENLPSWQTKNRESKQTYIDSLMSYAEKHLTKAIDYFTAALQYNADDVKYVIKNKLSIISISNEYQLKGSLIEAVINLAMSLYQEDLQSSDLDRETYSELFIESALTVSKLYKKNKPSFDKFKYSETIKDILNEEKKYIFEERGGNSKEYQSIQGNLSTTQRSITDFFSPKQSKKEKTENNSQKEKKARNFRTN
jgi:hypothetical protein